MNSESDTVSGWFVLRAGFQVHGRCPHCHSPNISYHKVRKTGLKGISASSVGLTPACIDCGKNLPTQSEKNTKNSSARNKHAIVRN